MPFRTSFAVVNLYRLEEFDQFTPFKLFNLEGPRKMARLKSPNLGFLLVAILGLTLTLIISSCSAQRGHRRRFRGEGRLQRNPRESKYIVCEETDEDRKYVESKCECPTIYAPVCGSDGVTYHNRCFIECKAKHQYFRFRHKKLTVQKMEPCDNSMHDTSFH